MSPTKDWQSANDAVIAALSPTEVEQYRGQTALLNKGELVGYFPNDAAAQFHADQSGIKFNGEGAIKTVGGQNYSQTTGNDAPYNKASWFLPPEKT